ncbi:serine hydrolase [Phenylobacterium hankyongense]|uniref:Serine hydrolase n=1 Tax=Phenylobacterium hankyongense TaxID=1813876 RepID=A0A328AUP0_9CAUL|nr:serine hydrolase [Phenylobacterium hankyongense]RAK58743.1 serine hydrolase [Phenylobacterium hankyongense]
MSEPLAPLVRKNRVRAAAAAALLAAAPLLAAAAPEPHARALAAGYKAAFLCSGIFNAGQSEAQVAADDLEGIYPEYQALVRTLPAQVDRTAKTVSVAFDTRLPPRIAAWRSGLGCSQLPIGAGPDAIARLPRLEVRPPAGDPDARAWPDGDRNALATPPPATAAALDAALGKAFDHATYGAGTETTAVLVVRDGRIVAERYRPGYDLHTPQRTWSAGKSLTATVIGRAVQHRLVQVEAPANVPEWRAPGDPRGKITLAQLMHMGSGLWTDGPGNRTDEVYVGGGSVMQQATAMALEAEPGSRWRYANNDTLLAALSVRTAIGDDRRALEFPFTEVLWRIGMRHTTPETDWQGNYILSSQVWTTARDLARLGLLYLDDGVWKGERLLPQGWSKFVATPAPAQPENVASGAPGYGAFFWLYGPRQGLPEGTYVMNGNRGQFVFIVPSRRVVIVRRGFDKAGGARFDEARFAHDMLAALD